jgi:signal transduction histidine kinase
VGAGEAVRDAGGDGRRAGHLEPLAQRPRVHARRRRIDFHTQRDGDEIRIEVRDTGAGIVESERPHVFERSWRGRDSHGGGGQGLFICRRIVGMQGGRVGFETEEGRGTTFYFTLPAAR